MNVQDVNDQLRFRDQAALHRDDMYKNLENQLRGKEFQTQAIQA